MFAKKINRGFTLIELLVVISIIGILAGLGITAYPAVMKLAKKNKAKATIQSLELAIKQYYNDFGVYPDDSSPKAVMNVLTGYGEFTDKPDPKITDNPDWNGPYYAAKKNQFEYNELNEALLDPWLSPYQFNLSDPQHNHFAFDIWSPGPNKKDEKGEGDDIKNW